MGLPAQVCCILWEHFIQPPPHKIAPDTCAGRDRILHKGTSRMGDEPLKHFLGSCSHRGCQPTPDEWSCTACQALTRYNGSPAKPRGLSKSLFSSDNLQDAK